MNPSDTIAEPLHCAQPLHEAADNVEHVIHHVRSMIRWWLPPLIEE
jgi:hypothetical protein